MAKDSLDRHGILYETVMTQSSHHATDLAFKAAQKGFRRIASVGGDGTFHEVYDGVMSWCDQTDTPCSEFYLAVIPIGSGNDWIKSFDIPNDPLKVVELMAAGSFSRQDVIKAETDSGKVSFMANVGGVGFDPHVCEKVNEKKSRGTRHSLLYFLSLVQVICNLKSLDVAVSCDGEEQFKGTVYDIAFGNGAYCGGGMRQCSLAKPSDGIIDAIVIPKAPILTLLPIVPKLFSGRAHKSSKIIYVRGKSIRVEPLSTDMTDIVELDGEVIGNLPVSLAVMNGQVNVLCGLNYER